MLAHIAGIPVEEAALGFAPIALAVAGLAGAQLRRIAALRRSPRPRRNRSRETLGVRA